MVSVQYNESKTDICDGVIRHGIDYVYNKAILGNQSSLAHRLNEEIKVVKYLITAYNDHCVKRVFRALCHFYFPPCGNASNSILPSSICQEECETVQQECQQIWNASLAALKNINPVINCSDTSRLLFPIEHCCTGAGLGLLFSYY